MIDGGAGDDNIRGENGNDTLDGAAGNDSLSGSLGNNTYLFGGGDGQDFVSAISDTAVGKSNVLQFKAWVAVSDMTLSTSGAAVIIKINGTTDQITFDNVL